MFVTNSDITALQWCAAFDTALVQTKGTGKAEQKGTLTSVSGCLLLAFCVCSYIQHGGDWLVRSFGCWLLAELAWFIYQQSRYELLNARVPVKLDLERIRTIKQRFLKLRYVFEFDDFISGWFHGAPVSAIRRGNLEDFVAYGFYTHSMHDLTPQAQQQVHSFIDEVQRTWGIVVLPGHNSDIGFMAHLWEPLRVFPLPLTFHLMSEALALSCHCAMLAAGFSAHSCMGMRYWLKVPPASDSFLAATPGKPLVFLHGVGLGLLPYVGLLRQLHAASPGSPLLLFDLPAVSMRLCKAAPQVDDIADAAAAAVQEHFPGQTAVFAAHSFGTFCVSRICQMHPQLVHSVALMDPVCMLTCYPQLLRSFVYKLPTLTEATSSFLGLANSIRWILARDLVIAETFCRKFMWHSLMLWPEDLPKQAVISAAAADDLVPAQLIARQLEVAGSDATFMLHPTAGHGGFLLDADYQARLVESMQKLLVQ